MKHWKHSKLLQEPCNDSSLSHLLIPLMEDNVDYSQEKLSQQIQATNYK